MSRVDWSDSDKCQVLVAGLYKKAFNCAAKMPGDTRQGLADHKDYKAAKEQGDIDAALRVVKSCVTRLYEVQLKIALDELERQGLPKPILVAPYREGSQNMLARTAAAYLGDKFGLEVDTQIVELPGKSRRGMDKLERFFSSPKFAGDVKPGATYIAIDDVITNGGTLAELRSHIIQNGGRFAFAAALAAPDGQHRHLKPEAGQVDKVVAYLGNLAVKWLEEAKDINVRGLTKTEAGFLLTREARDHIFVGLRQPAAALS